VDTDVEVSEMQPITVNPDGVASLLLGLGSFKAPFEATGPDDIPAYLLKETLS